MRPASILSALLCILSSTAAAQTPDQYRADALSIEGIVNSQYAYLDHLPGGAMPMSDALRREAEAVGDSSALLRYAEHAVTALADHHAITGRSFRDSWAVTPSYSDVWIERQDGAWRITAVRAESPAEAAGVQTGDILAEVAGVATDQAVAAFWAELGLEVTDVRGDYAARVLAAGRRDRPRDLTIARGAERRRLTLDNLYTAARERPLLEVAIEGGATVIRVNDSLGDNDLIAAFDAAMATVEPGRAVIIDLTETPGGGNTSVARAMMGWFVDEARPYQVHSLPSEERETGIPRQWIEEVLPRPGKRHTGPVTVRVGRWTGSMGEGLAIGFAALGADVVGDPMAGLLGAVYDQRLEHSGLVIKLPAERLYAVDGTPREAFRPSRATD